MSETTSIQSLILKLISSTSFIMLLLGISEIIFSSYTVVLTRSKYIGGIYFGVSSALTGLCGLRIRKKMEVSLLLLMSSVTVVTSLAGLMLEYDLLHRLNDIRACASTSLISTTNTQNILNSNITVGSVSLPLVHNIFACNENVSTNIIMQPNSLSFFCSGDDNYYSSAIQCSVKYLTGGNSYSIKPSIDLHNNKHCACYTGGSCTGFDAFNDCNSIQTVFTLETSASYYSSVISSLLSVLLVFISATIKQYQKEFEWDDSTYPVVPILFADNDSNNNVGGIAVAHAVCIADHISSRRNVVSLPASVVSVDSADLEEDDGDDSLSVVTRVEAVAVDSDDDSSEAEHIIRTIRHVNNISHSNSPRRSSRHVNNRRHSSHNRPLQRLDRSLDERESNHEDEDNDEDDDDYVMIVRSVVPSVRLQRQNAVTRLPISTATEAILVHNGSHYNHQDDSSDEDSGELAIRRPQYSSNVHPYAEV